ncbi:ATP-dependent zinc protease [Roseibium aggregatum]|uniref:ATP-dependent zinc protease n=1 Tax=Roseibium aggregatum TaxID=187304 RepID=A0A926P2G6_9HYPH|nr:RimK/LysX family protein [Roseibium aggregatum]MBD1547873.1 ATP-dependent zinc protease [Roseibium aggregatum]
MQSAKPKTPGPPADVIGWRELVALPELDLPLIRAKIDTGARTSALHAEDQEIYDRDGRSWVRFRLPGSRYHRDMQVEVPLADARDIKNTSGVPEQRHVIETLLILGHHHWHVEVSLANRENMGFDMILGRTAIRGRNVLVDPGRSFLAGDPVIPGSWPHK